MPLFVKPYVSEITHFIADLKKAKPALEQEQRDGRALLWDKPLDRDAAARAAASRVAQKPYVYGSTPDVD